MNLGLYSGASAMAVSERRLDAITANLASARATAYKRVTTAEHGRDKQTLDADHVHVASVDFVDWSQGPLERTGVPTDLALMGDGFFAVDSPDGEVYTRDGNFLVSDKGQLVTQDGFPVAWRGSRGVIDPVGEALRVDASGSVWQGARPVGRLELVDFPARDRLSMDRNGYYTGSPALDRTPSSAEVHQGALEASNVSSVDEMVALIQTQRAFEASAQVVRMVSQTYERLNSFQ